MKREVPLSDKARKVLEKQLNLLVENSEWIPDRDTAQRALAILNLIEVLEADDRCRERIARAEEYIKVMREAQEEEALERIREQAEQARRGKRRRMILIAGSIFLLAFFGILLFWML